MLAEKFKTLYQMPLRDVFFWLKGRLLQAFRFPFKGFRAILKSPRYTYGGTRLLGKSLRYADAPSFLFMYNEIFRKEIYKFQAASPKPFIIDCGANIGLSVIYFKLLYPDAEILAFEPDKNIFRLLSDNVRSFALTGVDLIDKAVWIKAGQLQFFAEGADGGRIALKSDIQNLMKVEAVRLKDHLYRQIDFLKIDIEGSELEVLRDCQEQLGNVNCLFVEYHSFAEQPQGLGELLSLLTQNGFRYYIDRVGITSYHPFKKREVALGIDLQLNIYAYRR